MDFLHAVFGNQLLALFIVVGLGLAVGNVTVKGLSLGASGVLFVALAAGHYGVEIPAGAGRLGLALFVYCVGIGAGGRFFEAFAREGGTMARLGLAIVILGALTAWGMSECFDIPGGLATGLFAGALTSTPALASASEVKDMAQNVAIGFGIAYPFGVIGVVLFVQIIPRVFGRRAEPEVSDAEADRIRDHVVTTALVEVLNPSLIGKRICEADMAGLICCQISRILENDRLRPLRGDDVFEQGARLLLVGREKSLRLAFEFIGRKAEGNYLIDGEHERRRLAVTSSAVAGRTLRELAPLEKHGVVVTRITRMDNTFVPDGDTRVEKHDVLTAVGRPGDIEHFATLVGHSASAFDVTDLVSLAIGLAAGLLLGILPLGLPGTGTMTLGTAGGPLFAGLILGHFRKVGPLVGHIPRQTRLLLQELGLVFFLADAGIAGGANLTATVAQYGVTVFVAGAAITIVPMMVLYPLARRFMSLTRLQALGGICGGMTSTPALGALTSGCDSQEPVVSYSTAYPVALIMMTIFARILLRILS